MSWRTYYEDISGDAENDQSNIPIIDYLFYLCNHTHTSLYDRKMEKKEMLGFGISINSFLS